MNSVTRTFREPKIIATITICGGVTFNITDIMDFTKPTEEQIKNLHDMLCIDVKLVGAEND